MALVKSKGLWASILGVLLSASLLVLVVGFLGVVVYTAVQTGTPIVDELFAVAVPVLLVTALLLVVLVASTVGLLWSFARNASLPSVPRSERLASMAERAEREYSELRIVGLSEFLRPPEPSADEQAEQALADLKQQYVEGDLTEREFERKVDRLVSNESIDEARAARERNAVVESDSNR